MIGKAWKTTQHITTIYMDTDAGTTLTGPCTTSFPIQSGAWTFQPVRNQNSRRYPLWWFGKNIQFITMKNLQKGKINLLWWPGSKDKYVAAWTVLYALDASMMHASHDDSRNQDIHWRTAKARYIYITHQAAPPNTDWKSPCNEYLPEEYGNFRYNDERLRSQLINAYTAITLANSSLWYQTWPLSMNGDAIKLFDDGFYLWRQIKSDIHRSATYICVKITNDQYGNTIMDYNS